MCSAYAYVKDILSYKRIFILSPSHHVFLQNKCCISNCLEYDTIFGKLEVDTDLVREFERKAGFERMSYVMEVSENGLEMQLPFISYLIEEQKHRQRTRLEKQRLEVRPSSNTNETPPSFTNSSSEDYDYSQPLLFPIVVGSLDSKH